MSSIKINQLSFHYENSNQNIFSNLNLALDSSWKLGLVGRNGRGKTTFLNLLRNKLQGSGSIITRLNFSYFPLAIANPDNLTLSELQSQANFEQWKLERELNLLQVDPNLIWQPFNTLSGGEQTKILLVASFTDQDNFPLIDEPTNHLDEDSRQIVAEYLKQHEQGYLLVSHDREFLNATTDHILAIENTEIHLYQGNYATYEDTKGKRDAFNEAKNEKLKGEIGQLNDKKVRFHNWSESVEADKNIGRKYQHILNRRTRLNKGAIGHAAAKMMKKSISAEKRMDKKISEKKGLMQNIEKVPELTMNFTPDYHQTLLETQHLNLKIGDRSLLSDLTFKVKNHDILALKGKNGSGKTTLLKLLLNSQEVTYTGELELVNNLKISYLPQDFTRYHGSLENFAEKQKISYQDLLNNLKKMGLPRDSFQTPIEEMSMGQQKRVVLAKSLSENANLYLWDEPANYLDVFNQDQLIKLLKTVQPAMLLIEHDSYFIKQVAKNIVHIKY